MTDSEIIKALECCTGLGCDKCKFNDGEQNTCSCEWELKNAAMEVLKRQQEEIERLTINMNAFGLGMKTEAERANRLETEKDNLIRNYKECAMEAVRDFAARLKARYSDFCVSEGDMAYTVDQIVTEMEGEV